jgi:hypothetical protein
MNEDAIQPQSVEAPHEPTPAAPSPATNPVEPTVQRELRCWTFALAGWLIPGFGHALQKMWGRAFIIFAAVGTLVYTGASMRGNVFTSNGGDAFDTLGYIADMGTGCFYFLARMLERTGADVSHSQGDYGTRFLATAGVLNILAALHAYEAARGRKA